MMKFKLLLSVLIMSLSLTSLSAQSTTVTGRITDPSGEGLIGATLVEKGTNNGVISDIDGGYSIRVANPKEAVLVVSYIGYLSHEVEINNRTNFDIKMVEDAVKIDEIVAIGYGNVRRQDITGSVASISGEDLIVTPVSDVSMALAGRIAGVSVTSSDGEPGSSISIRVRGGISITQSNEPLYVIDGFQTTDGLDSIDPGDVASIDVLKDASATAIYGAQGANGVIVVTTKGASQKVKKEMTVSFDAYYGIRQIANKLDVLSTEEFVLADYERNINDNSLSSFTSNYGEFADISANYSNREGIDWQEEALGSTQIIQNYRVGIAGGIDKLSYNLGYAYYDEDGAMVYSGSKKHNFNFNLRHQTSKRLSMNARFSYTAQEVYGMGTSDQSGSFNKLQHILQYRPTMGITGSDDELLNLGEDPLLADDSGNVMQNPILSASEETKEKVTRTLQANAGLQYKVTDKITFANTTGMRYKNLRYDQFYGDESVSGKRNGISGSIAVTESGSFQTSNTLTYDNKFGKVHKFTALIGQEWVENWSRYTKSESSSFPIDDMGTSDMSLGTPSSISTYDSDDFQLSFFSRVNYSYKSKYIATATLRADGSSKFGDNNAWGYFPSLSVAWRASEESFVKDWDIFSDLKVRVGYGLAGNNRISSYSSLDLYTSTNYASGSAVTSGYVSYQLANPDLQWEANQTFNIGIDMGFVNQRILVSPEFYINKSKNLLLNAELPASSGYETMLMNAGSTRNSGIDLSITSVNIAKKDFQWTTNLTLSHNKNEVLELTGEDRQLYSAGFGVSDATHVLQVGQAIGQFYGYVYDGVYQVEDFDYNDGTYTLKEGVQESISGSAQPGDWKFKDLDNDGNMDDDDKQIIGSATPLFYGGFNNTFNYKNFDLSIFCTFSYGGELMNATKLINTEIGRDNKNGLDVVNSSSRWMTINSAGELVTDPAELSALNAGKTIASVNDLTANSEYISSWLIEDASFFKISNITLGYTLPRAKLQAIGVSKLRIYTTINNLATFTKYSGYDPEVSTKNSTGLTPGVDWGAYPRSTSFIFGVNMSF